jgi:hypothetical protein
MALLTEALAKKFGSFGEAGVSNLNYNHCNIDGHIEDKCWEIHPYMNPKNFKDDSNKKNLLGRDCDNMVEINLDVDENIIFTST